MADCAGCGTGLPRPGTTGLCWSCWNATRHDAAPPPHGTRARYVNRRSPCDCDDCSAANTAYQGAWRARKKSGWTDKPVPRPLDPAIPDGWRSLLGVDR